MVNTRANDKFVFNLKRPRSDFYLNSPYYRGVHLWNALEADTQFQMKKESFKRLIKVVYGTNMKGKAKEYVNSAEFINRQRRIRARHDVLVNVNVNVNA